MEIKDNFPKIETIENMTEEEKKALQQELGIKIALTLFENIFKAEEEIYKLLMDITGMSQKDCEELSFSELKDILVNLFSGEDFMSFFK